MDAAQALADLLELSPDTEAAALFRGGEVLGAAGVGEETASKLADEAARLLDAAAGHRSDGARVTQIRAELGDASVFVVRDEERAALAVAGPRATPGLVFYDLKRALAAAAEAPAPKPRRRTTKKQEEAGDAA